MHWALSNAPHAQRTDTITILECLRASVKTARLPIALALWTQQSSSI